MKQTILNIVSTNTFHAIDMSKVSAVEISGIGKSVLEGRFTLDSGRMIVIQLTSEAAENIMKLLKE